MRYMPLLRSADVVLLVFWYVRERDDDVLVDEDEQRQEETQPDRAQCVQAG